MGIGEIAGGNIEGLELMLQSVQARIGYTRESRRLRTNAEKVSLSASKSSWA
jgi:hypothetical protein